MSASLLHSHLLSLLFISGGSAQALANDVFCILVSFFGSYIQSSILMFHIICYHLQDGDYLL